MPAVVYGPLLASVLAEWAGETLYLALDTSQLWQRFVIVRLALVYRGRALPLGWVVRASGSATVVVACYQRMLAEVAERIPRRSRVVLLADRGFGRNGFPAGSIHHNEAQKYVKWLSKKTGKKYRLPTEAEWTYFARAGAEPVTDLKEVAWFWDNSDDKTHKVGGKSPNGWGLHDMLGNVMEFVTIPGAPPDDP